MNLLNHSCNGFDELSLFSHESVLPGHRNRTRNASTPALKEAFEPQDLAHLPNLKVAHVQALSRRTWLTCKMVATTAYFGERYL